MSIREKNSRLQLVVLLIVGGLVVLSLAIQALPFKERQPLVEVSIVMRETQSSIWSSTRLGMEQAAYDLGGELRFLVSEMDNDQEEQTALLLRELQGGTDAVVVVPVDPENLEDMLNKNSADLPVISIESCLSDSRICVSPHNGEIGTALANSMEDIANTGFLLLDTGGKSTGVQERLQSCYDTLLALGGRVKICKLTVSEMQEKLPTLLKESDLQVVVAFEASATEALIATQKALPPTVMLYGVGSTSGIVFALEEEKIKSVAAWSDYAIGYLAVQAAIAAKRGEKVEHNGYRVRFSIVKGEDIYEENNQKLLFPVIN